jgi:tetratricopeptide (TPR) repeat protein
MLNSNDGIGPREWPIFGGNRRTTVNQLTVDERRWEAKGFYALTRTGHRNLFGLALAFFEHAPSLLQGSHQVEQWNGPRCMDKPQRLPMQMTAKGLVLLLALGLFLGKGSQAFARDDDPRLLNEQVFKLYQQGKYQEAIPLAERLLAMEKQTIGPEHPATAASLNNLALLYQKMGAYEKAEALYRQALHIRQKVRGPEHPDTANSLNSLALLYTDMGAYRKAEPLYQRAVQICQKALGPEHPHTVLCLNNLAALYERMGDYAKAEPLYQHALQIREKVLGPEHLDTAQSLNNLAGLYLDMGAFARAEPLYQHALRIREKVLGPEHPDTAQSLNNLAVLYEHMGAFARAEPLLEQALPIYQKALGHEHPATVNSLSNLAVVYERVGAYTKAEPLLEQALQLRTKALGPEHPDTATSFDNLAAHYRDMGAYRKAEPLFEQALQIRQKALGPDHPHTANSLNNLACLYRRMGDYARAKPLLEQALQICQKSLGPDHPDTATSLNHLALFYLEMGDYARAEPLLEQALQIRQKALGPDHPDTADSFNNLRDIYHLALFYLEMGDYARAEPLYRQALQIRQKALGPDHPDTADSFNNLGDIYQRMGAYEKAKPLLEQALQIYQKALGPDHPVTARNFNDLGLLYFEMGDYARAEPLLEQARQIRKKMLGEEHPDTAASLHNLASLYEHRGDYAKAEPPLEQALQILRKALGPDHPNTAISLENEGLLKFDLGQVLEAKSIAQQSAKTRLAILSKALSFTSEQQRLAYQNTLNPYSFFALLDDSDAELAEAVLRYKGVVLDSLIEDRLLAETSKTPQDRELLARLGADKQQLGQFLLQTTDQRSGDISKKAEALEREVEQIEGQLAQHVAGLGHARRALSVTVEQVQAGIPKDGALIEYLRYGQYLGKGAFEPRYGAVVLASSGHPRRIALGSAKDVDATVSRCQALVREGSDQGELSATLETLYGQLWRPIDRTLPAGIKRAIISPDGQLNFVSFATLLDSEERFVAEKYAVQYVASGRDLMRDVKPPATTEAILFANPDFTLNSSQTIAMADDKSSNATGGTLRGTEKRGIENLSFPSLEGTQKECDQLAKAFEVWHWKVDSFTGKDATKEALSQVHSPYILHLATHGFFEPADEPIAKSTEQQLTRLERSVTESRFFKNPMHCSGLALAGAQSTLEAWRRADVPPVENDGILTAEDVAALDLKGTWLVTLSACDTGEGEAKAGEGVLGLRRGFLQAGAQHLLMTLWPISDEKTVQIMTDFYDAAHESGNAPEALAKIQRDWLVKIRSEHGLTQAVRLAGPFVISSQGKP